MPQTCPSQEVGSSQPWLAGKAVIWVDATGAPGRTVVQRPDTMVGFAGVAGDVAGTGSSQHGRACPQLPQSNSVLVVDDSLAVRAQLRALLEARGLNVTDVDSAEAAIKAATAYPYACILMDVLMPGMTDMRPAATSRRMQTDGTRRPSSC